MNPMVKAYFKSLASKLREKVKTREGLAEVAREVGEFVGSLMPPGVAFTLLMSNVGQNGSFTYLSTADRESTRALLVEAIAAIDHEAEDGQ